MFCDSGLLYWNQSSLPGIVDIQSVTLDDPDALPTGAHIQTAKQPKWTETAHTLQAFERYPSP